MTREDRDQIQLTDEQIENIKVLIRGIVGPTAQFGPIKANKKGSNPISVCSTVNARDGYGGKTGYRPFTTSIRGSEKPRFAEIDKQDGRHDIAKICRDNGLSID
ncbi:hypothetical protein [Methylorubrum sp. POS3]|uniref:hypothetical protein n=1 Tax=Methylorubrum sp. POS3 TaxID=2998492 RepID=UPI003729CEC8